MSQASTSLDLSEFFNNDDSDGQRLAEFLQERRGGVRRQNFVFLNSEPERLSLKVQLEKLPPSQPEEEAKINNNNDNNNKNNVVNENEDKTVVGVKDTNLTNNVIGEVNDKLSKNILKKDIRSNTNNHVEAVSKGNVESVQRELSVPTESPSRALSQCGPINPRLSILRNSGGVSPGDRLRRHTLKRSSKIFGRRTLLQEFESTVSSSNFEPPLCSTPLSRASPRKSASPPLSRASPRKSASPPPSVRCPESENMPITAEGNTNENNSCCDHTNTLIRNLQRKDEELKNYMDNLLEATLNKVNNESRLEEIKSTQEENNADNILNSPESLLKRTYTVEKGLTAGQVILTPEKIPRVRSPSHSHMLRSRAEHLPKGTLKTPERRTASMTIANSKNILSPKNLNKTTSHVEDDFKQQHSRAAAMLSISRSFNQQKNESLDCNKPTHEIPNTPPPGNNISIVLPTADSMDVEIPETQNYQPESNNIVELQTNNEKVSVVVIPVTQNFGRTSTATALANKTGITTQTESPKLVINTNQTEIDQPDVHKNDNNILNEINEDNVKLTDIITDDEDETPKAPEQHCSIENSRAPLNLVLSSSKIRTKRLRKRSMSRRKLQMDNSQHLTETENGPPPLAHSNSYSINRGRTLRRKKLTLNKPPGTPLNGEKFAQELARMSNYEILDLRKRNSLGKIFSISGRKSVRASEDAVRKQQQLDDQIDMELLRRNLQGNDSTQYSNDAVAPNVNKEVLVQEVQSAIDEFPPVPDEFRDARASSLVDEQITDRISFKSRKDSSNKRQSKRGRKKKEVPEELKQYLWVSKMITEKKKNYSSVDQTRRSLYSQELSDSPDKNSSEENTSEELKRYSTRSRKESLSYLKSPPKSKKITFPKVVSPPPPITPPMSPIQRELGPLQLSPTTSEENEFLPPPPPTFESDFRDISPINFNSSTSADNTKKTTKLTTTEGITHAISNNTNKNDDEIFKKPLHPPPKRKARKDKTVQSTSNVLLETSTTSQQSDQSTNEQDSTLRRSKRGHVPLKQSLPIFQKFLEKTLRTRWEEREKRAKQKKILKINGQSSESYKPTSTQKPKRTRNVKLTLPTVPENDLLTATTYPNVEVANEISTNKKAKRNQNKNKKFKTSNDAFECSRLTMVTPPPIDHLNNVFDQLRNSSSILNSECPPPHPTVINELKVKPVRVRVARIKSAGTSTVSKGALSTVNKRQQTSNSTSNTTSTSSISCSSIGTSNNSNYELISWLKNVTDSHSVAQRNDTIFKEMRISTAAYLSFTELQGVEYAFYDTEEKASLGYLRFKPRQKKPKKKTKRFHLHFVTLVGNFRVTANNEVTIMNVGDMVAIEKTVYYDIENLTDDIGILMVIKK